MLAGLGELRRLSALELALSSLPTSYQFVIDCS